MSQRGHGRSDVWLALAIGTVSLFFVVYLQRNPSGTPLFGVSPSSLPLAMAALVLALSVVLAVQSLIRRRPSSGDNLQTVSWRLPALLVLCLALVAAMPTAGYLVSGGVFIGAVAWLFGARRPVVLIALVVATPLALSLFFEHAMVIYLPAGRLLD